MSELSVIPRGPVPVAQQALSVKEVVARVNKVREIANEIMQENIHYGKVGGGDKKSLWQPGAEILLMAFQLAPELHVEDVSAPGEVRYRVTARVRHVPSGEFVGVGIGECSSDEEKYKWRSVVSEEEWNETPEDRRRKKWKHGKQRAYTVAQIRTEPADVANTILKMAKKRALVDAAKSTTAASDVFAQDLEDLDEEEQAKPPVERPNVETPKGKEAPQTEPPAEKPAVSSSAPPAAASIPPEAWQEVKAAWHSEGTASEPQVKRLFAIAHKSGWRSGDVAATVHAELGVEVDALPNRKPYDRVVAIFEAFQPASGV